MAERRFLLAILFCLLWAPPSLAQYLDFTPLGPSIGSKGCYCVADLDGDGSDEVVVTITSSIYIYVWSQDRLALKAQLPQPGGWILGTVTAVDVDGDGRPEVVLELLHPDEVKYHVYRYAGSKVSLIDVLTLPRAETGGRLDSRGPYPWDIAGRPIGRYVPSHGDSLIVFGFAAGYSRQPRGVIAFRAARPHNVAWKTLIGPSPSTEFPAYWYASQESTRIFLSGSAVNNGAAGSGLGDSVAALVAVDGNGRVAWSKIVGRTGAIPQATLADVGGPGRPGLLATTQPQVEDLRTAAHLQLLDPQTGSVFKDIEVGAGVMRQLVTDLDGDGAKDVVVLTDGGELRVYDRSFTLIARHARTGSHAGVLYAADIDFSGQKKIFVSATTGSVVDVFDHHLRKVGQISLGGAYIWDVHQVDLSPRFRALAVVGAAELLLLGPGHADSPPWIEGQAQSLGSRRALGIAFAAGAGLALLLWALRRAARAWRPRRQAQALVSELKIIRHGARIDHGSREPVRRLLSALRTCAEEPGSEVGQGMLREVAADYRDQVAPVFARIVRLAVVTDSLGRALALAREVRRADAMLRPLLSDGADGAAFSAACTKAADSLARVEELLKEVESAALARVSADPVAAAGAACAGLQRAMDQAGVEFGGLEVLGRVGARVFFDSAALRRCCHDLLRNSLDACREAAGPRVRVRVSCGERQVVLEVCDNGAGVPAGKWESIFHGVSTKTPPGGLGLSRTRMEVEAYSGRVGVRASKPWEETVIEVELCRAPS